MRRPPRRASPPPGCVFDRLRYDLDAPAGTGITVNVLSQDGSLMLKAVKSGRTLGIKQPVQIEFALSTTRKAITPRLNAYSLSLSRSRP